ncbi:hypothetical protein M0802_014675 [Mischocyttarus mexicanus]|nr:hypothetical protein M0802_014675 [Mischocyttarus mexicanus]
MKAGRIATAPSRYLRKPCRCKLAVNGLSVEQVIKFRFLGVNITSSKNLIEEVPEQTRKAAMLSGCLGDIIWRNKYMSTNYKSRIYKTCVRPIMSYAIETRAEIAATKRPLRSTEMKTLRTMTGKKLFNHQRNDDIRKEYNV